MKYWNELPESEFFNVVFKRNIEIGKVEIMKVEVDNDRPQLYVSFDFVGFLPDSPPTKWVERGFNRCGAGMMFYDISELTIINLPNRSSFDVQVIASEKGYEVFMKCDKASVSVKSKFLQLCGPSVSLVDLNSGGVL